MVQWPNDSRLYGIRSHYWTRSARAALDRVKDFLRLFDHVRCPAELQHLSRVHWPARGVAGAEPSGGRVRAARRAGHALSDRPDQPLGAQELLLPRSAEGLPD